MKTKMFKCNFPDCPREFDTYRKLSMHKRWHDQEFRKKLSLSHKGRKLKNTTNLRWSKKQKENKSQKMLKKSNPDLIQNFFEYINNEETAYWLGFLYGDGNIGSKNNTIQICLKESDKEHLEKFNKIILY